MVGTSATIAYAGRIGWIGIVIVDPEHRGRGVGTRLLEHAIDHLDRRHVPTMKLDATPLGQPLYEQFGFRREYAIERWMLRRPARARAAAQAAGALEDALELDRLVFGADRGAVLRSLAAEAPEFVHVAGRPGAVTGYGFGRRGSLADQLGPWVAGAILGPEFG